MQITVKHLVRAPSVLAVIISYYKLVSALGLKGQEKVWALRNLRVFSSTLFWFGCTTDSQECHR